MIIEVKTVGEFCGFVVAAGSVVSGVVWTHWKIFAAPMINRLLAPMMDNVAVHSRLLKKKHSEEYKLMEMDVLSERALRGNA